MTPAGIEPVTFRFIAQHLNHCATMIPRILDSNIHIFTTTQWDGPYQKKTTLVWLDCSSRL